MNPSKITIVTDSTSDIPDDLLEKYQINVVNNLLTIEGKSYLDRVDISRQDFYERLPGFKTFPTTATASSGVYQLLYEKLFHQGFDLILSIHASSKLSGIINAANIAAQLFDNRVKVIDSESISLGLGFQVLSAMEGVIKGLSLERILEHLDSVRRRIRVVAMLDTLEYIRRSGRVGWVRARLGDMLRIKPLVELRNGLVFSLGEARTYRKGIYRLIEILKNFGPLENLAILHTNAEQEADNLFNLIKSNYHGSPIFINVTTVIGSHVGPNGLGFVAMLEQ